VFCGEQWWLQAETAKYSMKRSASISHGELYLVVRNGSGLFSSFFLSATLKTGG